VEQTVSAAIPYGGNWMNLAEELQADQGNREVLLCGEVP
jgi:hypothetical protein